MKKLSIILTAVLLVALLLTGCQCKHEWADATCEVPKTCTKCGETEGEALGHTWAEATCEEAKHCTTCGKTEGEPAGHTLTEADYWNAAVCTVCGAEVGEPLEPYFVKMGVADKLIEFGKPYDYKCEAPNNPAYTVTGKFLVDEYETFESDDTHEALEGYEWKRVKVNFFIPESELEYGGHVSLNTLDFYTAPANDEAGQTISDGEDVQKTFYWNGKEYDGGLVEFTVLTNTQAYMAGFMNTKCWIYMAEFYVRVPVGYDGVVLAPYNKTSEIKELKASGKSIDEATVKAPDTLFFRLN